MGFQRHFLMYDPTDWLELEVKRTYFPSRFHRASTAPHRQMLGTLHPANQFITTPHSPLQVMNF